MNKKECTRIWISDSGLAWHCHPKNCVFCDNCTDIWYDTSGPYMILCKKNLPQNVGFKGQCKEFTEENPIIIDSNEYYEERRRIQKQASDFMKERVKEVEELFKKYSDNLFAKCNKHGENK